MINKDTLISDLLKLNPRAPQVLARYEMEYIGSSEANFITIEQSCKVNNLDLEEVLNALNTQ